MTTDEVIVQIHQKMRFTQQYGLFQNVKKDIFENLAIKSGEGAPNTSRIENIKFSAAAFLSFRRVHQLDLDVRCGG